MADCYSNFEQLQIGTYITDDFVSEKCLVVEYINNEFIPVWINCPEQETIEYLGSLWTIIGEDLLDAKIYNAFTGYYLENKQKFLYDIPEVVGKTIRRFKILKTFSLNALSEDKIGNILKNYKITNEWLQEEYLTLKEKSGTVADRLLSKNAIFIIGNSGSGKTGIINFDSVKDFFASLGIIKPISIDYDDVIDKSELFKQLRDACDSLAFKRVYDILYSSSSNLINIEEKLAEHAIKLGSPLLFHMINFNSERARDLKSKGYTVHVLIYVNNEDLSKNRYLNAKKGLVKNLNWLTKEELVKSIDKNLIDSIYVTENGHVFKEINKPSFKDKCIMQDMTHMFKATINIEKNGFIIKPYNCYRFNNSIIHYKDNIYVCAYRIMLGNKDVRHISDSNTMIPIYIYSNGLYPDMWAKLYNKISKKNDIGIHINGKFRTISNSEWIADSFITLCLLQFKNNTFSLIDGTEQILYTQDPEEDPRLYKKSDGKIYMYYMSRDAISATDIANKLRPNYCPERSCYFVIESQVEITGDNTLQVHSKRKFDSMDRSAPKVLCLQSQIDHASSSGILFDKNYAPYSWSGQDYFGYSITKKNNVYKRGAMDGSNIDCSLLEQSNMHPFFAKLFDYSLDDIHFIHSISQNTPAIQWDSEEYICVGHMRLQNFMHDNLIGSIKNIDQIPNISMGRFYKQEWLEYSEQEIFVHGNIYFMFFYTFNPKTPSVIKRISHCFIPNYNNRKFTLCFAMSLSFVEDRVCLTFGEGDVLCRSILMTRKTIEELLFDIDKADPNKYKFTLMDVVSPSKLVPDSTFTALDTIYKDVIGDTFGTVPLSINNASKIANKFASDKPFYKEFIDAVANVKIEKLKEWGKEFGYWNDGLLLAAKEGYLDIVKIMLEKGADKKEEALLLACDHGRNNITTFLLDNYEYYLYAQEHCFLTAVDKGYVQMMDDMLKYLKKNQYVYNKALNEAFIRASRKGNLHVLSILVKNGANFWNDGLIEAFINENLNVAKFMIEHGATNLNVGLTSAIRNNNKDMVNLLIKNGANNFYEGLITAAEIGNKDMALLMIDKGAIPSKYVLNIARRNKHEELVPF